MLGVVLLTLVSTCLTKLSTNGTYLLCLVASKAHQLGGSITNCRTLHIKLYAPRHHLYVLFLGTGCCAMITNRRTTQASLDALFIFMVSLHNDNIYLTICTKYRAQETLNYHPQYLLPRATAFLNHFLMWRRMALAAREIKSTGEK